MKKLFMLGFSVMAMVATSIAQDIRNNPTSNHGNKKAKQGDTVRIAECRPLSKLKRWKLVEVIAQAETPVGANV